ncbi:MAG: PDDEXK nuclease domain-containing protein [Dysgonamonadaceae bacterium]|jgi:predicted nuclease of restriction endonuclease-like (RecB) superfamily|nr:PDDEXK nuclease domain-containing protein [Dysgonamonadaceae bacterium]
MDKTIEKTNANPKPYRELVQQISTEFEQGQRRAMAAVHSCLVDTYWKIGQHIVEFEQQGKEKAVYGSALLENLSRDLKLLHGKGFSRSNIQRMRQFYLMYPICATPSHKLSWSHIVEILKIEDDLERSFYEKQTEIEKWSVAELKRQKDSGLFLRLALSKEKEKVLQLAKRGQIIESPEDVVKDVYVFEFLKIPEPYNLSETELETRLLDNLQSFLLELGKGFTFVARQFRMTLNNAPYRVDLVFYHRILRCFVLIDLKIREVKHNDIGQMNMYMGYFANEENVEGDNPPVGIILSKEKDELLVEYATYGMNSQLFVSKYQLYLPDREELKRLIYSQLEMEKEYESINKNNSK